MESHSIVFHKKNPRQTHLLVIRKGYFVVSIDRNLLQDETRYLQEIPSCGGVLSKHSCSSRSHDINRRHFCCVQSQTEGPVWGLGFKFFVCVVLREVPDWSCRIVAASPKRKK